MSSSEPNITSRPVFASTSHGGEISIENITNEVTQEADNNISKQILKDFCDNTTVQGFRYFTDPTLHRIERLWWKIAVISSFVLSCIGMINLWQSWNQLPVIITHDGKFTSISKIPFPAITICSTKKFSVETVDINKITKALEELPTNKSALNGFTPMETASEVKTVWDNPTASLWNRDDGYQSYENEQLLYPERAFESHNLNTFGAVLTIPEYSSHEQCSSFTLGFYVSMHPPDELPQDDFIHVPPEQFSTILIKPNVITTSDGLRSYAPHTRNCFFESERHLHFFKSYSHQKCELECLTNFTKDECGCVHYSMPREKSTRVCTMLDMDCYTKVKHNFGKNLSVRECDCLPDCTSITYDAEVSQVLQPFHMANVVYRLLNERPGGFNDKALSIVLVSFKEPNFIIMSRTQTRTMYDLISDCGSLLCLFIGVSILSIVEIVYYFTLRLYLLWRGQPLAETTVYSNTMLASIMKTLHEKLKPFQFKKSKHKIIPVRPVFDDDPDQILNESEMQTEGMPSRRKQLFREAIRGFCDNSTIHGLRYFTEPSRHQVERIWWAIAIKMSLMICIISTWSIWTDWQQNPVITSFDTEPLLIETVPFPAVTVCPNEVYVKHKVNIEKIYRGIQQAEQIGNKAFAEFSPADLCQMIALSQTQNLPRYMYNLSMEISSCPSIYETMKNMVLDQNSTVKFVTWLGERDQLSFKPIFTPRFGLCYTFNSLNSHQIYADNISIELKTVHGNPNASRWNREGGYQPNIEQNEHYPRRLFHADISEGLFAVFDVMFDSSDVHHTLVLPGTMHLMVHSPDELPGTRRDFLKISTEQDTFIWIRPSMISTSDRLRSYAPHARSCYYKNERRLRFFKSYSQRKCELECLTNFTRIECGCVRYFMPSLGGTKICSTLDWSCYSSANQKFYSDNVQKCDCLPDCTSISYQTDISTAPYHFYDDDEQTKQGMKSYENEGVLTHSRLFVSFKENHFTSVNRSEIMTTSGFVSKCGGLLNLFMGILAEHC